MRSVVVAPASVRGGPDDSAPGDAPLELALLGTLAARRSGIDVPIRLPDQAIRLLAYLLLYRDRIAPREHVAFTLWPDDDESDARANLRRKLHLIGKALPPAREPWIVTTSTHIGWNAAAPYRLDVEEFERAAAAGASADADALYRGDLLTGFDDEWLLRERDRLRSLAIDNALSLLAHAQRQRDFPAAIRWGGRVRGLDPWREDAVRALITLRYESGDRAGALGEYERFHAEVVAEMGVEPMPETVCVYEAVLDNAPAGAGNSGAAVAPARAASLPFVDREREFPAILAAWNAAGAGNGTALFVVGEAGIGKSRLLDEFATFAGSNGGRTLRGGSTPFEIAPYQPFSEAFRSALPLLRDVRVDRLWLGVLATLVPALRETFPDLPEVVPLDAEPERARLFEAVDIVLAAIAAARPTVMILEDLHWAGSTTIALFEYLARRASQCRLLLVASYREDDLSRMHPLRAVRRRLERERLVHSVALGPLDEPSIAQIVSQYVDGEPQHQAAIVRYLHESSDGNPFFLSEVIANDRELGLLDAATRRWEPRNVSIESMLSLTETLTARLQRLSAKARSIAEIAAVIGRSFSAELVREVSGIDERTTRDCIDELIDRRLVRDVDAASIDFAFSHQLIQQAVYASMSLDARRMRHRRVGGVMEEIYSEQLEEIAAELASQFDRGGEPEHAAEYYCLAARQALNVYATQEAQQLAERGCQIGTDALTQFRCIEILEEAARRLGDRDAQRAAVEELLPLAESLGDAELTREALRRKIEFAHDRGARDAESAALDALAGHLTEATTPWPATYAQLKGSYLIAIGAYREARSVMADALRGLASDDYPRIFVDCRCALVELASFEGEVSEIRSFLADVPHLSRALDRTRAAKLWEAACVAASTIQDYAALTDCAQQLLECARDVGYREAEAAAYGYAGRAALRLFEIDRARELLERATSMFAAIGQPLKQLRALNEIGSLATTIGNFDEAIRAFTAADEIATAISYHFGRVGFANNISYTAYLKGDYLLARSSAARALEIAISLESPSARAHALVSYGIAERELGNLRDAVESLTEGTALERSLGEQVAFVEDRCELVIALLRDGQTQRAVELNGELLALARDSTQKLSHPQRVFWTAAATHYVAGDIDAAVQLLTQARRILDSLEAAIPDQESRTTFRQLRHNRAIDAACDRGEWNI